MIAQLTLYENCFMNFCSVIHFEFICSISGVVYSVYHTPFLNTILIKIIFYFKILENFYNGQIFSRLCYMLYS